MYLSNSIIVVSKETQKKLKKIIPFINTTLIFNGTLPQIPTNNSIKRQMRMVLNIPIDAKVVCFIGRLSPQKGISGLVSVATRIIGATEDVYFIVVGDGSLRSMISNCIKKYNGRVLYYGEKRNVEPYYMASDILFLPSITEGLPMTILEAFSYGLPTVASRVGGVPDVVVDGYNGFLCDPSDYVNMSKQIIKLLYDDNMRLELGNNAMSTLASGFYLSDMVHKTYAEYLKINKIYEYGDV